MSLKGERRRWKNQRKEVGRQKLEVREHETGRKKEGERERENGRCCASALKIEEEAMNQGFSRS